MTQYSLQPLATESVRPELPVLAEGVSVDLLRRVWNATPADRKHKLGTLLESRVLVAGRAKALRLLTLDEVEAAIGAVAPRFFVRFYDARRGKQVQTFVERADADAFAATHTLFAKPAKVEPLTRKAG